VWDKFSDTFGKSIFHPQYLIKKYSAKAIREAQKRSHGRLIDIGCGRMPYRQLLEPLVSEYIGLDHPISAKLYRNSNSKPDILSDARQIPVSNQSFDTVLLLEVLEHVPYPIDILKEARRIIKNNGILIISTPFMYPLHDKGFDYMRYTGLMLRYMIQHAGFKVVSLKSNGTMYEFLCISVIVYILYRAKEMTGILRYLLLTVVMPFALLCNIFSLPISVICSLFHTKPNRFPLNFTVVAKPQ
jgi:SAM-dependent methyltransferase